MKIKQCIRNICKQLNYTSISMLGCFFGLHSGDIEKRLTYVRYILVSQADICAHTTFMLYSELILPHATILLIPAFNILIISVKPPTPKCSTSRFECTLFTCLWPITHYAFLSTFFMCFFNAKN